MLGPNFSRFLVIGDGRALEVKRALSNQMLAQPVAKKMPSPPGVWGGGGAVELALQKMLWAKHVDNPGPSTRQWLYAPSHFGDAEATFKRESL